MNETRDTVAHLDANRLDASKIVSRRRPIRLASWLLMGMLVGVIGIIVGVFYFWYHESSRSALNLPFPFDCQFVFFLASKGISLVIIVLALIWGIVKIYDKLVEYQLQFAQKIIDADLRRLEKVQDLNKEILRCQRIPHKEDSCEDLGMMKIRSMVVVKSMSVNNGDSKWRCE